MSTENLATFCGHSIGLSAENPDLTVTVTVTVYIIYGHFVRDWRWFDLVQSKESVILWLNRYAETENALDDLLERIAALRSRMESPRAATITGMPHGGGYQGDAFARGLSQIEELEDKAQDLLKKSRTLYSEINDAIDQIIGKGAANMRTVLRCRYIDRFEWSEVNQILFARRPDFDDRLESYVRRTFRIHKDALEALQEIVSNRGVQEITERRGDRK